MSINVQTILWWFLAAGVAFVVFLFILPMVPGLIKALANDPNRYRPEDPVEANKREYEVSHFGYFTPLAPGQVKWIETQGERAIRAPMRNPEHLYRGELKDSRLTGRNPDYWEVQETPAGEADSHPIPFPMHKWRGWRLVRWWMYSPLSIIWWVWKRWVYEWTGYVWVGPYPYRRVRTSRVDLHKIEEQEDGREYLVLKRDYSDHYRVIDFQFPVTIQAALTRDKIALRVVVNAICRVNNVYKVAYFTDDLWSIRLTGAIKNAITNFLRGRNLDEVLTPDGAANPEAINALAKAIQDIGKKAELAPDGTVLKEAGEASTFGIFLPVLPQIREFSITDPKDREALSEPRRASAARDADLLLSEGKAAYSRAQGQALRAYPEALIANIPSIEGWIAVAQALNKGNGTGILNMGSGTHPLDPVQIEQLKELRRLTSTSGRSDNTPSTK